MSGKLRVGAIMLVLLVDFAGFWYCFSLLSQRGDVTALLALGGIVLLGLANCVFFHSRVQQFINRISED